MTAVEEEPTSFEMRVDFDAVLESAVGPAARILGSRLERGELVLAVERGGEVDHIRLRDAVRQQASALRSMTPVASFGSQHELLAWIDPVKREKALILEAHLIDVLYGRSSTPGRPAGVYDAETTTISQRRKAKVAETRMSQSTMTRRLQDYQDLGVLGLVRHARRLLEASGALDVDPEILAVAKDFVNGRRDASKKSLLNEYALLIEDLRRRGLVTLNEDAATDAVPFAEHVLPYTKFARMIRHLERGRDPRTAKIRQQQNNRPQVNAYRHRAYDFCDRVEMDSTPVDVFVRSANGPVQAHAVFAICTSTRYAWVRVVAGRPTGRDLALLLWDMAGGESAFVPGSLVGASSMPGLPRREMALNAWRHDSEPPASLPGCVVFDHGSEEENRRLIRYCAQLGITIRWARTREPADKAYVESFVGGFSHMCQLILGHKGNTVENHPSRQPEDVPTIEMLQAAVSVWQQAYVQTEHTGLPHPYTPGHFLSPIQAVQASLSRGVPLRGFTDPTRALGLLEHVELTPQDDGVTFRRRRYTCPGYEAVVTASLRRGRRRTKMTFYVDPNRPGRLYWPVPGRFEPLVLMCPEEAGEAVLPFADVRSDWLSAVQGRKEPTANERGLRQADLAVAIREAVAKVEDAYDNVVSIVSPKRRGARPGRESRFPRRGGWDLTSVMNSADDPDGSRTDAGGDV